MLYLLFLPKERDLFPGERLRQQTEEKVRQEEPNSGSDTEIYVTHMSQTCVRGTMPQLQHEKEDSRDTNYNARLLNTWFRI